MFFQVDFCTDSIPWLNHHHGFHHHLGEYFWTCFQAFWTNPSYTKKTKPLGITPESGMEYTLGFLGHLVFGGMTGPPKHTIQTTKPQEVFAWKTRVYTCTWCTRWWLTSKGPRVKKTKCRASEERGSTKSPIVNMFQIWDPGFSPLFCWGSNPFNQSFLQRWCWYILMLTMFFLKWARSHHNTYI